MANGTHPEKLKIVTYEYIKDSVYTMYFMYCFQFLKLEKFLYM